jgi:dTDP-glucose 4,6-dehydratase
LKAARRVWLDDKIVQTHRFHHVSTDEVYGSLGPDDAAFTETTPYAPNSPYSASKASSDHLVRAYHHTYGLHTTVSNCSNNYGPYQFPEKLIPLMILKLLSGGNLPVYGDGLNVRDWLHVEDHCRGIEAVLERGRVGEVYNIGGRSECENIVLVKMLCALIDEYVAASAECRERFPQSAVAGGRRSEQLIEYVKDRPGHDRRYAIDCSKIEAECGFRPTIALGAGLRSTIAWYLEERRKPASQLAENVLLKVPGCELVMGALPGARLQ